jgi:phosphate starvation-inducible PhoH-like protein
MTSNSSASDSPPSLSSQKNSPKSPERSNHEVTLHFENARAVQVLHAYDPANLRFLEAEMGVKVVTRDGWLKIEGSSEDAVVKARQLLEQLHLAREKGVRINQHSFRYAVGLVNQGLSEKLEKMLTDRISFSVKKEAIVPKTLGQMEYLDAIRKNIVTIGLGPAGTGKTYLAMAMAVQSLKNNLVNRIILTRPAVEAGESLGFLPGDLQEKLLPYLRPLYDALNDMLELEEIQRYMDRGIIEIAPLAYMRGRTLSQAFVIIDEAQNATTEQMFMLLTRLGQDSKCVVTGDPTQIDLPHHRKSGLVEAVQALQGVPGICLHQFHDADVVRHEIVSRIIAAYRQHRGQRNTSLNLG